jgi:hypothetical protein
MNLSHLWVAVTFGFIVSSNGGIGSLAEVFQTSPSWWTATAKSIALVGIAFGMRFMRSFGLVCGNSVSA